MMWNLRELPNKHLLLFSKGPLSLSTLLRRQKSNEITETDCTPISRKNVLQLVVINDAFTEATPSLTIASHGACLRRVTLGSLHKSWKA